MVEKPTDADVPGTANFSQGFIGKVIAGRYTLLEKLGEGGMGDVWVAQQTDPVRRKVALKLIKPGMDSRQVIARFELERQALALMDHPNIAHVLDGGLAEDQRPFFVMELVSGMPLNKYADQKKLTLPQRLELFVPICQAVQHAHQKGIVHRDLKPGNILVTEVDGKPSPRIIDFGVAKALSGKLTEQTLFTNLGAVVGTLEYMSPEQAGSTTADVDTRADIYSLGVLLYELLTGLRPFDSNRLRHAAIDEMVRILRDEDPPSLASRLSTNDSLPAVAALRQIEPRRLVNELKGELDWIVRKCLDKDRNRRYESANGLSRDLQRYLAEEPVEARPQSASYRLWKFCRRNRWATLAAMVVVLALITGIALSTWGLLEAREQESRARNAAEREAEQRKEADTQKADALVQKERALREAENARQAEAETRSYSDFLINSVLDVARPEGMQGGLGTNVTVLKALEVAEQKLPLYFKDKPRAEALARHSIGVTWRTLGRFESAEKQLRQALEMRKKHLGETHPETDNTLNSLAVTLLELKKSGEAIKLFDEVILRKDKTKPETTVFMHNLANMYWETGQKQKAMELMQETLDLRRKLLKPTNKNTLYSMADLAAMLDMSGNYDRAITLSREVLSLAIKELGEEDLLTARCRFNLALVLKHLKQHKEALEHITAAAAIRQKKMTAGHPDLVFAQAYHAELLDNNGRYDESSIAYEKILPDMEKSIGVINALHAMKTLADQYARRKQHAKAIELLKTYNRKVRACQFDDPTILCDGQDRLAMQWYETKDQSKAEMLLRDSLAVRLKRQPDSPATAMTQIKLGIVVTELGQVDQAMPLMRTGCEKLLPLATKLKQDQLHWLREGITCLLRQYRLQGNQPESERWQKSLGQLNQIPTSPP